MIYTVNVGYRAKCTRAGQGKQGNGTGYGNHNSVIRTSGHKSTFPVNLPMSTNPIGICNT